MGEEREGYVQADGVRLHYLERRAGAERSPAVLLLHGMGSNARVWARVADHVPGRRVVMLDQRGHGRSRRPASGYDIDRTVADTAHVIESLVLGRPVVGGHGWGALVALELAVRRRGLVSAVAYVDGPSAATAELEPFGAALAGLRGTLSSYASRDEAVDELVAGLGEAPAHDVAPFVRAGLVERRGRFHPTPTARVRRRLLRAAYAARPEDRFAELRVPALLAMARPSGAGPDGVAAADARRRAADRMQERAPAAVLRWYDCGHQIPLLRDRDLAADLGRLAVAAAFADVAWRAAALDGDWTAKVHDEEGGWDARELLAHLASTQTAVPLLLRMPDQRPVGPPFDPDRWNGAQVRRRRTASPAALIEELQAASDALPSAVLDADLRRPTAAGPFAGTPQGRMLERTLAHQLEHLRTLERALGGRGADAPGLSAQPRDV